MSTNSTSSIYGSVSSNRVSGLMSGLDTESLVEQMTQTTQIKINRQFQAQQNLVYRQDAYRNVISKLTKFSDTYFSYTSKTNLLNSDFFKSSTIKSSFDDVKVSGDVNAIKNLSITNINSVASSARFTANQATSSGKIESNVIIAETDVSTISGQSMSIQYGKDTYTISIDQDFTSTDVNDVAAHLNEKINKITDLRGKIDYKVNEGKLVLNNTKGADISIIAAGKGIIDNLHIALKSNGDSTEAVTANDLKTKSYLDEVLLKGQITFDYNNTQKTITFNKEDFLNKNFFDATTIDQYNNLSGEEKENMKNILMEQVTEKIRLHPEKLNIVIQDKLDSAFGSGKIEVSNIGGKLSFKTLGANQTDIFGVSSISTDLKKHVGIFAGSYNRINKSVSISKANFKVDLDDIEEFKISVNGKEFTFDATKSINDIIDTINKDTEANVTISHSSVTDKFTVISDETGLHAGVEIKDVVGGGNLAAVMFGTGYDVQDGTDAKITVKMNGVEETITRSSNNIFFDGVNIELSNKAAINAAATIAEGDVNKVQKEITFTVTDNVDETVGKIAKFVDDYNELIKFLDSQIMETPNKDYQPLTTAQKKDMSESEIKTWEEKAKAGMLYNDRNIVSALYDLRESVSGVVEGNSLMMATIGIGGVAYDYTGKLNFDEETFRQKYAENPDEVTQLFTQNVTNGTQVQKGIAIRMQEVLSKNVGFAGEKGILVDEAGTLGTTKAKNNYLSERIKDYEDTINKLKEKMEKERTRYWEQFSRLESVLNKLNSQSSWLAQQFQ